MKGSVSKKERLLGALIIGAAFVTYIAITASRMLYNSEKLTLIEENIATLTDAANVFSVFMVSYALAQIILAVVMKKMNLKRYIIITITGASLVTSSMVFTSTIAEHYVIFALMGVFQAGFWSCNLKLLSVYLPSSMLPSSSAVMTMGPGVAGALSFGVAALFGSNWRLPFLAMGVLSLVSVIVYTVSLSSLEHVRAENSLGRAKDERVEIPDSYSFFESGFGTVIFYAVSIFAGCSLLSIFTIIGNNFDVYLKLVGNMDVGTVKIIMVIMPLVAAVGPFMTVGSVERRKGDFLAVIREYVLPSLLFIGAGLILFCTYVIPTFILFLVFYVLIHGSRAVILSVAPFKMREKLDTGVYSITVNATCAITSGIIPVFAARIIENNEVEEGFCKVFVWMLLWTAAVAAVVAFVELYIRSWAKKRVSSAEDLTSVGKA